MKTNNEHSNKQKPELEPSEIKQQNELLQAKVIELSEKLKTANDEIQSVIYSVSHDLRAPLRAIDGYSRILEQDYSAVLDEEGLRLLNIVRSSTKNMDELMTDLLSLSRVGTSEIKTTPINMNALVNSVFDELAPFEIRDRIAFSVDDLPEINSDLPLLRQAWVNLISNAIKFSLPKENPKIAISGSENDERNTYVIRDNGVGFNPEYKKKLFGLFQHLHKVGDFEGTGVGLAIVQRIVRRLGGQVFGDGQVGLGAEFTFTLPKNNEQ